MPRQPTSAATLVPHFPATSQLQTKRNGGLLSVEVQEGEADKFEALARARHLDLPQLIRQLLLQEYYRGQRLASPASDQALAQAVAHARGMFPNPQTLPHALPQS